MNLCRFCLSLSKTHSILTNPKLIDKIKDCVSIEITTCETYSQQICDICLENINKWFDFKIMCLKSKAVLESKQLNFVEWKDIQNDIGEGSRNRKNSVIKKEYSNKLEGDQYIEFEHNKLIQCCQQLMCDNTDMKNENQENIKNILITSESIMNPQEYGCDICNEMFEYYTDYLDHQNDHNGEAIFNCAKCRMSFSNKKELVMHEKNHKIPCDICGKLILKQSLRSHLVKHTDKFKCSYCSSTFTSGSLLKDHVNAIHMKLKLQFCEVCGKDFATKSSLVLHLKTHSAKRQYKCDKCDYAGRTSIALKVHKTIHEKNTCICEYCPKIFKSNKNLYDHLRRTHHSQKKYACEYCGMKFALRYLVEQHKRTHTGIHPYKCSKCLKTFARSDGLSEHVKIHNRAGKIYKCQICSKSFLTPKGLKKHHCQPPKSNIPCDL